MTLGTIIAFAGVAILIESIPALLFVGILSILLVCYLKLIEEKEFQIRFGEEYSKYKNKTSFIIPIPIRTKGL
jgi:protein-S-isoprenylcysteine O-methyltransferase Ste14